MTIISPSLLSCNFLNIAEELKCFEKTNDLWFHLDIMDGHFVPNLTFGHPVIKKISSATSQKLDAHCMVSNPEFYIDSMQDLQLHNFTFHYEACGDSSKKAMSLINKAKKIFPSVGISIKPSTPLSVLSDEILKSIDLLLIMSVEPGFSGQSFIESTYAKLLGVKERMKSLNLHFQIQIDGGVSNNNAQKLVEHGAGNLVAGSYIFKADPQEYDTKIESLRN